MSYHGPKHGTNPPPQQPPHEHKPKVTVIEGRSDKVSEVVFELVAFSLTRKEWHDRWAGVVAAPWLEGIEVPKTLARIFGEYYKETGSTEIDAEGFLPWARMSNRVSEREESKLLENVRRWEGMRQEGAEPDPALANRLEMEVQALNMSKLVQDYRQGKSLDMLDRVRSLVNTMEERLQGETVDAIELDIDELLLGEQEDIGLKWRLDSINLAVRPLLPGTFVIVAACPDQGKSSFIASEVTFFARQLSMNGTPSPRILWLNNEGRGQELTKRIYQAALNATTQDLADKARAGTLSGEYRSAIGECQIEVIDIHSFRSGQIETLIKERAPQVVVFDMLDNVAFDGAVHDGGNRTDQILEQKYQWARNLGVIYNTVVMATSQISADGSGMQFPYMHMLKDSKVGKQGAADIILMIGSLNDGTTTRYISTPKNKRGRPGRRDPRAEAFFDPDRSRYLNSGITSQVQK